MPGNHDYRENDVNNNRRRNVKIGAIFTFALLAVSGGLLGAIGSRRAELIETGASRMDRLQSGFLSGNLTFVPRFDPEEKERCNALEGTLLRAFANGETENIVRQFCHEAMRAKTSEGLSDETPCEVNVAPGTDEEQIAELKALDSTCKMLAEKADSDTGYVMTLCLAALSLLYTVYHGIRVCCDETQFERQPREGDIENLEENDPGALRTIPNLLP